MLTFFTTAKRFRGHDGIIQRNALKSWTLLHPDVEVVLFGDEKGAAETARELGLRHEPHVECNQFGTKRLVFMFRRAQAIARHELLCYINCDILLIQDFCDAEARCSLRFNDGCKSTVTTSGQRTYAPTSCNGKERREDDRFLLEAPGRWKYFRCLLSHPWTYGEIMTRRHRVYSYMRACSALVLGYHHLHLFDDARRKRKEWMASSSEKTLVALHAKAKAAAATKS